MMTFAAWILHSLDTGPLASQSSRSDCGQGCLLSVFYMLFYGHCALSSSPSLLSLVVPSQSYFRFAAWCYCAFIGCIAHPEFLFPVIGLLENLRSMFSSYCCSADRECIMNRTYVHKHRRNEQIQVTHVLPWPFIRWELKSAVSHHFPWAQTYEFNWTAYIMGAVRHGNTWARSCKLSLKLMYSARFGLSVFNRCRI